MFFNLADKKLQSWINWDYNYDEYSWYNADGSGNLTRIIGYVRPYPQAVAGIPKLIKFDPQTLDFKMIYDANAKITSPTEIFVPRLRYKSGYNVTVESDLKYHVEHSDQTVLIYIGAKPDTESSIVKVIIIQAYL